MSSSSSSSSSSTATDPRVPTDSNSNSSTPPANQPSLYDAFQTISPLQDFQRLPSIPCARQALLFGILAGTSVGTLRFLFGGPAAAATRTTRWDSVGRAANWAVASWGIGSLGAWETCRRRQSAEQARMHALVTEIKARRTDRSSSASASASSSTPRIQPFHREDGIVNDKDDDSSNLTTTTTTTTRSSRPRKLGGVLMGERGIERLQSQQLAESGTGTGLGLGPGDHDVIGGDTRVQGQGVELGLGQGQGQGQGQELGLRSGRQESELERESGIRDGLGVGDGGEDKGTNRTGSRTTSWWKVW